MRPARRCALSSARRRSPAAPSASSSHACPGRESQRTFAGPMAPMPRREPSPAAARWGALAAGGGRGCLDTDVVARRRRPARHAVRARRARAPARYGHSLLYLLPQSRRDRAAVSALPEMEKEWGGRGAGFTSGSNSADDASLSITELPHARASEQPQRRAGRHAPGVAHLLMLPVSSGSQPASASLCSVLSRVDCSTPPCGRPAQVADRDRSLPCPSSRVARDALCEAACCVCSASCLRSSAISALCAATVSRNAQASSARWIAFRAAAFRRERRVFADVLASASSLQSCEIKVDNSSIVAVPFLGHPWWVMQRACLASLRLEPPPDGNASCFNPLRRLSCPALLGSAPLARRSLSATPDRKGLDFLDRRNPPPLRKEWRRIESECGSAFPPFRIHYWIHPSGFWQLRR